MQADSNWGRRRRVACISHIMFHAIELHARGTEHGCCACRSGRLRRTEPPHGRSTRLSNPRRSGRGPRCRYDERQAHEGPSPTYVNADAMHHRWIIQPPPVAAAGVLAHCFGRLRLSNSQLSNIILCRIQTQLQARRFLQRVPPSRAHNRGSARAWTPGETMISCYECS